MDRKTCSHPTSATVVLFITWCGRCSGWRVTRSAALQGSFWDTPFTEVYESHFLPVEETGPSETTHLINRAFLCAQELVALHD